MWDITSSKRMRVRLWTAMFNEVAFVFWNTNYAKDGHRMNIWLGPQERQYVASLQCFAGCLDKDVKMADVEVSGSRQVRAYALASAERAAVYVFHGADYGKPVRGLTVTVQVPKAARAYWYSPTDASILGDVDVEAGKRTFAVPEFTVDIALLVTNAAVPDIDRDGKGNDVDEDNDNDGVPNAGDAWPLEAEETADRDGDLIGDVIDADDNGDGVGDDDNRNGIPDCQEMDTDGDAVPKARAIPWDAFPWDKSEWRDTDGDGIGDNVDADDDGDGYSDEEERREGTDPLNKLRFPREE